MTESEWWSATDASALIDWLFFDALATDRKLRLYSVACCERVRHLITDPACREMVESAEAFADGLLGDQVLLVVGEESWQGHEVRIHSTMASESAQYAHFACLRSLTKADERSRAYYDCHGIAHDAWWCSYNAAEAVACSVPWSEYKSRRAGERVQQVCLLHDIFGPLPFRDIVVQPSWLTSDVLLLARGIYEDKAFDRMPILADALQDAGCDNDDILSHCRAEDWEHVRGCWVIDLLLGKPWRESS